MAKASSKISAGTQNFTSLLLLNESNFVDSLIELI
jgi:hypothetical protein